MDEIVKKICDFFDRHFHSMEGWIASREWTKKAAGIVVRHHEAADLERQLRQTLNALRTRDFLLTIESNNKDRIAEHLNTREQRYQSLRLHDEKLFLFIFIMKKALTLAPLSENIYDHILKNILDLPDHCIADILSDNDDSRQRSIKLIVKAIAPPQTSRE